MYGELNRSLPVQRRQVDFQVTVHGRTSAKDAVESTGVPHTEIALLLVNGSSSHWETPLHAGDRLAVYPYTNTFDLSTISFVHQFPPRPMRFILDVHLGRLASYLRLLGIDCLYSSRDLGDPVLVRRAVDEQRILLTMDHKLLMHKNLKWGRLIRRREPREQVVEVLDRFSLRGEISPLRRCAACNHLLTQAQGKNVEAHAPGRVYMEFLKRPGEIKQCPGCGRIYWPGSHLQRIYRLFEYWDVKCD